MGMTVIYYFILMLFSFRGGFIILGWPRICLLGQNSQTRTFKQHNSLSIGWPWGPHEWILQFRARTQRLSCWNVSSNALCQSSKRNAV